MVWGTMTHHARPVLLKRRIGSSRGTHTQCDGVLELVLSKAEIDVETLRRWRPGQLRSISPLARALASGRGADFLRRSELEGSASSVGASVRPRGPPPSAGPPRPGRSRERPPRPPAVPPLPPAAPSALAAHSPPALWSLSWPRAAGGGPRPASSLSVWGCAHVCPLLRPPPAPSPPPPPASPPCPSRHDDQTQTRETRTPHTAPPTNDSVSLSSSSEVDAPNVKYGPFSPSVMPCILIRSR